LFVVLFLPGALDGSTVVVVLDGVGGLLFENCIVDASIFWKLLNGLFVGLLCVSLILSNLDIFE